VPKLNCGGCGDKEQEEPKERVADRWPIAALQKFPHGLPRHGALVPICLGKSFLDREFGVDTNKAVIDLYERLGVDYGAVAQGGPFYSTSAFEFRLHMEEKA
jgi:hypothetical protein